ncbi:hypothetical protein [Paludibaculum fermentans]|uniref:Zinc resistance-associated protein n=1 Tax=Paludibaculum fermentans TaxID=1473598 RepID=A0A7S7SNT9_PALFE|nr:hypothetical protein [Paludibaculum fermentans]QOY90475.1 hypothetical protein IRI77_11130 [Paludibaculum fermentans]
MMRSNSTLALSLILVFASGTVVGALGYRSYSLNTVSAKNPPPKSPEDYRREYIGEMQHRLSLQTEQVQKLETILDETRVKFRELRERSRPEMKAIQDAQTAEINAMLNPAQQVEYEKFRKERDDKRKAEQKEKEQKDKEKSGK